MPPIPPRFHVTHSCGHQAWWENADLADAVGAAKCPWCGGETGQFAPYGVLETQAGRVFPTASMVSSGDEGEIPVAHRADETCCGGTVLEPFFAVGDDSSKPPERATHPHQVPEGFLDLASDLRTAKGSPRVGSPEDYGRRQRWRWTRSSWSIVRTAWLVPRQAACVEFSIGDSEMSVVCLHPRFAETLVNRAGLALAA